MAKKNLGIIKELSIFLPHKTLDQMYKALVRSHLDYCDIVYHIPSVQTRFGLALTDLMEKDEMIQYQAALAITGSWQGSSRLNCMKNWDGNPYLNVVGVGVFYRSTRL